MGGATSYFLDGFGAPPVLYCSPDLEILILHLAQPLRSTATSASSPMPVVVPMRFKAACCNPDGILALGGDGIGEGESMSK